MTHANAFDAHKVAVLADCHIHSKSGPDWTPAILDALADVRLIVTLGDMGEAAGLDRLQTIAPVIGVRGGDDEEDARTAPAHRALEIAGVRIGCVFDPTAHGLALCSDPLTPSEEWEERAIALFGGPIQAILRASTHRSHVVELEGVLWVDPGSAVLPADGAKASFACLR